MKSKKILLVGGCGFIGHNLALLLKKKSHEVFIVDNLSNSHQKVIDRIRNITKCTLGFSKKNVKDGDALDHIFKKFKPEAVMHFAGLKAVGESVIDPLIYYNINLGATISLLEAMDRNYCSNIIFSSSATVYGIPHYLPYDENHPTSPVNPYGRTKLIIEKIN